VFLLVSLLVFLLVWGLRAGGQLELPELSVFDLFIRMQPKINTPDQRITIIEVTEEDIQTLGQWPLTDAVLSKALQIIISHKPKGIGVDIFRDIAVPPGSEELEALFIEHPNLVGVMTVGERGVAPHPVIRGTGQAAFVDILIDPGGIVRRGLLFLDDGVNVYTSFALTLALLSLWEEGIVPKAAPDNPEQILLKQTVIPPLEADNGGYHQADARGYQYLLDYRSTGAGFRTYGFMDLLSDRVPVDALTDKLVLLGVRAQSVHDSFFTPLSTSMAEDQQMSGVVLHAHMINQLFRFAEGEVPISTLPAPCRPVWLLFWSLLGGLVGLRTRSAFQFVLFGGIGLLVLFGAGYVLFLFRQWVPVIPPTLAFSTSAVAVSVYLTGQEKRSRALLMNIFSKHVSKEIAEMIWQEREQFMENGRPRSQEMTVTGLFSDIRGFTTTSERMTPQELFDWLNTYMEGMSGVIMEHRGVIDNYVGDAIKADFGVPLPRTKEHEIREDAQNAVDCALAMEREMLQLNDQWKSRGLPSTGLRIGIHTGNVVAGLLGSAKRLKYTTLGDAVNTASRLESLDKSIGNDLVCRILISENTRSLLGEQYVTEPIGEMSLKGKEGKIVVHRVLGKKQPASY